MVVHLSVGVRGPPTSIATVIVVFLLCGRMVHSFGHTMGLHPTQMESTCQSGSMRTERTTTATTEVAFPTHLRTVKCARYFSKMTTTTTTKHKPQNRASNQQRTTTSANQLAKQLLRVDVHIHVLQARYTSARLTRWAPPLRQIQQQNIFSNEARDSVLRPRCTAPDETRISTLCMSSNGTNPPIRRAKRAHSKIHITVSDQTRNCTVVQKVTKQLHKTHAASQLEKQFGPSVAQLHLFRARYIS